MASEEDNSEDEEIMVDAAVRLSLQAAVPNGAGASSGLTSGPSRAALIRAAAAEKRLARNNKLLNQISEDIDNEDDDDYSDSDSQSITSISDKESEEEPLSKKEKKKAKVRSKAVISSLGDLRQHKKRELELKRALKKEERALAAKLGRRLTPV